MKKRSTVLDAAVCCAVRLLVFFLSVLPMRLARWFGKRLGDIARLVDKRHRELAERQVRDILGLDPDAAKGFVKRNFQGYGLSAVEFSKATRMRSKDFEEYTDAKDFTEFFHGLLEEGNGVLAVTAHFGNWEWFHSMARQFRMTGIAVVRPLDNPILDSYVKRMRERNGLRTVGKKGAVNEAIKTLRNNETVAVLMDQNGGRRGVMSPFLGKPAPTQPFPLVAVRVGSPVIVTVLKRDDDGRRFSLLYNPVAHRPTPGAEPMAEARRLVDAINADLSSLILQAPEQWFWIHNRWRTESQRLAERQAKRK